MRKPLVYSIIVWVCFCLIAGLVATVSLSWACAVLPTPFIEAVDDPDETRTVADSTIPAPDTDIDLSVRMSYWGRTDIHIEALSDSQYTAVDRVATGLPFRALEYDIITDFALDWTRYDDTILIGSFPLDILAILPLRIRAGSFIADVIFWAIVVAVILLGARAYLRKRRQRRAFRCPKCAYDLRGASARCPECGADHSFESLMRGCATARRTHVP